MVCLEKNDLGLRLVHFGNLYHYSTKFPNIALLLLKELRAPKSLTHLLKLIEPKGKGHVFEELRHLIDRSYIFEEMSYIQEQKTNPALRFLVSNQEELQHISHKISCSRVGVVDFNQSTSHFKALLLKFGLKQVTPISPDRIGDETFDQQDLVIVIGEPKLKFEFSKLNQVLYQAKKPWLLVTLDLYGGIVGPTFGIPGGPCYDCMIDHSRRHFDQRFMGSDFNDLIDGNFEAKFLDYPVASNVLGFAAVETIKIQSKMVLPTTYDGFYAFDCFNFRMEYHNVAPSPACPTCSGFVRDKQ